MTGFEKLIIDADRLGGYQKLLGGVDLTENGLAKDAYLEVEPAGHFLGCSHTMANYETAFYESSTSDSDSFEQWSERGGKNTAEIAYDRWNQMLKDYEAPPLDPAKDEELRAFIEQEKSSKADAWY